ncbi:MAG: CvpA family protein [Clostridia bacterium]|nr:CvpA family protein [Clostridia bacterium]
MTYPEFSTYVANIAGEPIHLVVDILLIAILLSFIIHGAIKGFVSSVFTFIKPVGSIILAFLLCRSVGNFLFEIGLFDGIIESVKTSIIEVITEDAFLAENQGKTVTGFTGIIGALLALSGNTEFSNKLSGLLTCDDAVITEIACAVVSAFAVIVAFVGLLLLGRLFMSLVCQLLNKLCELPGLKAINIVAGLLFGALIGAFVTWLSSYLLYFLCSWLGGTMEISFFAPFGNGEGTYIQQFFFHFNPIQFALQTLADSMVFA